MYEFSFEEEKVDRKNLNISLLPVLSSQPRRHRHKPMCSAKATQGMQNPVYAKHFAADGFALPEHGAASSNLF